MDISLKSWELYFIAEDFTIFNMEIGQIIEIYKNISIKKEDLEYIARCGIYECSFDLYEKLGNPTSIKSINCAISEKIYNELNIMIYIETRIVGTPILKDFLAINTENVGKLVGILGTVCRVGYRKIENLEAVFKCTKCGKINKTKVIRNIYNPPSCICKGRKQIFIQNHPENKYIDKQEIKLQEVFGTSISTVEIELSGGLVGCVAPGDVVEITGIIAAEKTEDGYKLKLEGNNINIVNGKTIRNYNLNMKEGETDETQKYNSKGTEIQNPASPEFQSFKEISDAENLMEIFKNTFYFSIVGHDLIKEALILALFGGTRKFIGQNPIRAEIHILIIGDPGLGKSKILLASSTILPKSIYVCGNFCTIPGLTVSIMHDPNSGEYMADAGALVISDSGICCIDEFDKLDNHSALFEVMEDQVITVAKGGVICSVPTRPTIIAASNPKHGHFNKQKSIRENLSFDPGLLSRFDLVFTLLDDLGEKEDLHIFEQLLKKKMNNNNIVETLYNKETLMKYIEYARNVINPVLNKAAKKHLKEYYMLIRSNKTVNIRSMESLIRLTESYAKMELKSIASKKHASSAIKLYKSLLIKDDSNSKNSNKRIETLLKEYLNNKGALISKEDLIVLVNKTNNKKDPDFYIEMLNNQGFIIRTSIPGNYKICP